MGVFDFLSRNTRPSEEITNTKAVDNVKVAVGATMERDETQIQSFTNSNITFRGTLTGFDYDSILRDKQNNIVKLYQLVDYYADKDPIIHGILHHVFVPFSTCSNWYLTGTKKKTVDMYEKYYKKIRLTEKLDSIFLEYWKYGNVFIYLLNGNIITLPVHKCKIGNVTLNGKPIVDYDCQSIIYEWKQKGYDVKEGWIKDNNLQVYFRGYPPEIMLALNEGHQYAQLNPLNTFVMQSSKQGWQRYAIPFIASCLSALAKKELISTYEDSLLNLGIRSFVHVKYGDEKRGADILPDIGQLTSVRKLFHAGMSGFPLVVTNQLAKAEVIQPDLDDMFQWDKYKEVNADILSAGGISGIIVSGQGDGDSTFATAQISMQTAEARINAARNEFCDMMNRLNEQLSFYIEGTYNLKNPPQFNFMPLDMSGKKALREACNDLWEKGVISTRTMMETNGYSIDIEKEKKEEEKKQKIDDVFIPRDVVTTNMTKPEESSDKDGVGRKELDNDQRKSDPENAIRGKMPKPSSPEGSL